MTATPMRSRGDEFRLQGRHVLGAFLAFFGVILAVNGYFLYSALSTHTGIVSNEPYRKGLAYNERIAADERQSQLGWHDTLELTPGGSLRLVLVDANGKPVAGMKATAVVGRPSTARHDHALVLAETEIGDYRADAGSLEPGSWLVTVEVRERSDGDPVYRLRRRFWLKQ